MKLIAKIKTTQKPILFFLTNKLPSTKIKKERGQVGVQPSIRLEQIGNVSSFKEVRFQIPTVSTARQKDT